MIKLIEIRYKMRVYICILLFTFFLKGHSQEVLVYTQEDSSLFSNIYYLYPKNQTFKHEFQTDDGQLWYGQGRYFIKGKKLILNFGDVENGNFPKVTLLYNNIHVGDSISVNFLNREEKLISGFLQIKDSIYYSNFDKSILIDRNLLTKTDSIIHFYYNNQKLNLQLSNIKYLNKIEIEGIIENNHIHYEANFIRELRYDKDVIISPDYYQTTKGKRVKFKLVH